MRHRPQLLFSELMQIEHYVCSVTKMCKIRDYIADRYQKYRYSGNQCMKVNW